ncbi:MAG: helix-turn-helix domain-containing protein [Bacteroidales bacterium]
MTENERFILILETLKKLGLLRTDKEFADNLHIKKTSLSDIRYNRKCVSIDILRNCKKTYPIINLNWIIMGEGKMFTADYLNEKDGEYNVLNSEKECTYCKEKDKRLVAQEKLIQRLEQLLKA